MKTRLITIVLASLTLAACGREAPRDVATPPSPTPQAGGRLVVALTSEPATLNPLLVSSSNAGQTLGMMHRSLIRMTDELQWAPALADRWAWSEDGRTLDLHLRPNLRWSDGTPFGPQDVVAYYQIYDNPAFGSTQRSLLDRLQNIMARDEEHVRIAFRETGSEMLRAATVDPLPVHIVGTLDPEKLSEWPINRQPVTLGPFRLQSWTPGAHIVLERNPHYYGDAPLLDEVQIKFVADGANQILQLQTGEVDMLIDVPALEVARLERDENIQVISIPGRRLNYLVFNLESPLFEDRRVREAISHAIDRHALVDGIFGGHATQGGAFLPPILWSHHPGLKADAHDAEQAALLLTEAGWVDSNGDGTRDKGGVELRFELVSTAGDPERENAATLMRGNLEDVGIAAEVLLLEQGTQINRAMQGDFDVTVVQLSSSTFTDPSDMIRSGGRYNFGHYANPEIDELLAQALSTDDRTVSLPLWHRLQEILHADKPFLLLYYPHQVVALRNRVRDATPGALSPFYGLEKWWVAP